MLSISLKSEYYEKDFYNNINKFKIEILIKINISSTLLTLLNKYRTMGRVWTSNICTQTIYLLPFPSRSNGYLFEKFIQMNKLKGNKTEQYKRKDMRVWTSNVCTQTIYLLPFPSRSNGSLFEKFIQMNKLKRNKTEQYKRKDKRKIQ